MQVSANQAHPNFSLLLKNSLTPAPLSHWMLTQSLVAPEWQESALGWTQLPYPVSWDTWSSQWPTLTMPITPRPQPSPTSGIIAPYPGWHFMWEWQIPENALWQEEVKCFVGAMCKGSCHRAPGPAFWEAQEGHQCSQRWAQNEAAEFSLFLATSVLITDSKKIGPRMRKCLHQSFPLQKARKSAPLDPVLYSRILNSAVRCIHIQDYYVFLRKELTHYNKSSVSLSGNTPVFGI